MPRILLGVTVALTAQAFLVNQMTAMVKRGWDVHLVCSPDDGTNAFLALGQIGGITLHPLPMVRHPSPLKDLKSLIAWLGIIRRIRPDLVVTSTPKAGLIGMIAARLLRVPKRVYHVRGLRAEGLRWPLSVLSRSSERLATAAASAVLIDSPSLQVTMQRQRLVSADKGTVLGLGSCCGVDIERFRPPSAAERLNARGVFGFGVDDVVIGFVGRLTLDKGLVELMEAANRINSEDPRVRLLIIGPQEEPKDTRAILAQAQASHWAAAPGRADDPLKAYWAFDVFCLPSYREGFPIASLEAQACGLPVVTTTATGCVDSILVEQTGKAVSAQSTSALYSALAELVRDAHLRRQMGADATRWVRRNFDQRLVNDRVIEFLCAESDTSYDGIKPHD